MAGRSPGSWALWPALQRKPVVVAVAAAFLLVAAVVTVAVRDSSSDSTDVRAGERNTVETTDGGDLREPAADGVPDAAPGGVPGGDPDAQPTPDAAVESEGGPGTGSGGETPAAPGQPAPGATPNPGGEPSAPPAPPRGTIKIGVAIPDLSAFGQVSENYDVGDTREQFEAILDGWKKRGLVPVNGWDITFAYREFNILNPDEKIAACRALVQDDKVFAVIGGRFFDDGGACVAGRFDTPMITINGALEEVYSANAPFYFTVRTAIERQFVSWAEWAHAGGHLKGKTIGLYFETPVKPAVTQMKRYLADRGYEIEEEVETSGSGIGSTEDQIAVQRFRSADVDLAMLIVGGTSATNFMVTAEAQRYRPKYIDLDYGEHTTDAATSTYPAAQYDGTVAMTQTRIGELAAGMPHAAAAETCVANYERYSGGRIPRKAPETAEYNNIVVGCDVSELLLAGLRNAGADLTHASLVAGLEKVQGAALAAHGAASFGPSRHDGVREQRTIKWTAGCTCWRASGKFTPLARA